MARKKTHGKCVAKYRSGPKAGKCKSFAKVGSRKTKSKRKSGSARKGRCLKWSKGRTRCLRRAA